MLSNNAPDLLVDGSPAADRTSRVLVLAAAVALLGSCLLTSPSRFSEKHHQDTSLFKHVVSGLALGGAFPTARGVEIRNLMFYSGAAVLALIAALRLVSTDRRPRASLDDLLDFRRRASSPYFWLLLLVLASVLSSVFSVSPDICKGKTVMRFLHLAWWWPLAALLAPRHAVRLAVALCTALGLTAAVGLWYYAARNAPGTRLQYPIGNELWLAACLLPGPFVLLGLFIEQLRGPRASWRWPYILGMVAALGAILAAMILTESRSGAVGFIAGAFAVLCLAARKTLRRVTLLIALCVAIGGALWMQSLRTSGVMGQRAHSIRARLNYEWPYALTLALQKPVLGWGDGAYSMLAGQYARQDQLDDPNTLSFDEWSWPGRAHNEFLQTLADLGIVGMLAFAAAIVVTLWRALQYCDRTRAETDRPTHRWIVIGLGGALVALVFEECGSPALREPGLPPIFLTVWAALWALVRSQQPAFEPVPEDKPLGNVTLRMGGVVTGIAAVILGYFAVQDWRGALARQRAVVGLAEGRYDDVITQADLAGGLMLDPFQQLLGRLHAIRGRSLKFDTILADSEAPPTDEDIAIAQQALVRLNQLTIAAPRFLQSARLRAGLSRNLSLAHQRRGESVLASEYQSACADAWERHRADEPFRLDVIAQLWMVKPEAHTLERLGWLRCFLRRGGVEPGFLQLFRRLSQREDLGRILSDLHNVAEQDLQQPSSQWRDRLAPETFRVLALANALTNRPEEAAGLAGKAIELYEKAGPRLFAAHATAIYEMVSYRFNAEPMQNIEESLDLLAWAQTIRASRVNKSTPLPGSFGRARLYLLLSAGREVEAEKQLEILDEQAATIPLPIRMAQAYVTLAGQFATVPRHAAHALNWARRATELAPKFLDGHALLVRLFLSLGEDTDGLGAAKRVIEVAGDAQTAYSHLRIAHQQFPGSPIWDELRRQYPDFPLSPAPTTQAGPG